MNGFKDVRVQLRLTDLNKAMRGPEFQGDVNRRMARVAAAAGPKFRLVVRPHPFTARAYVEAKPGAKITDADVKQLLRAVDEARK